MENKMSKRNIIIGIASLVIIFFLVCLVGIVKDPIFNEGWAIGIATGIFISLSCRVWSRIIDEQIIKYGWFGKKVKEWLNI